MWGTDGERLSRMRGGVLAILFRMILFAAVLAASLEVAAYFIIPPWPAYLVEVKRWGLIWTNPRFPMGFRDTPARFDPASGGRLLLVGDSFLEAPERNPLPAALRRLLTHRTVVNLGISSSWPRAYYHRLRTIGALYPDVRDVVVVFYEGNDFVGECFSEPRLSLVSIWPQRSLLSWVMSRSERLYYFARHTWEERRPTRREALAFAAAWKSAAPAERASVLVRFLSRKIRVPSEAVADFLSSRSPETRRFVLDAPSLNLDGGYSARAAEFVLTGRFESPFRPAPCQVGAAVREFARILALLRSWPTQPRLLVFWAPEAYRTDPLFARRMDALFRRSMSLRFGVRPETKATFFRRMKKAGAAVSDLTPVLRHPGTYRADGHWSARGTEAAAKALAILIGR